MQLIRKNTSGLVYLKHHNIIAQGLFLRDSAQNIYLLTTTVGI